ncbi:vacuolar protein sorting-associated protein 52 homolog isoform X1 [Rhinoraja longicauda]
MQAVGGEMLMGDLDITCNEFILDEVDTHIQANLEDELVKEALKTGVDLRHYSKQVETELQYIEHASIKDYIKESENIASLHNQITACDTILERMEQMLGTFQSDLSSISCEIQTLQEQSIAMNIKLKNRQSVRSELSQLVDELIVPAIMISTILDTPVTEQQFLEQLHELNNKINYVKEQSFKETLPCADVQDILDRLKIKNWGTQNGQVWHRTCNLCQLQPVGRCLLCLFRPSGWRGQIKEMVITSLVLDPHGNGWSVY